MGTREAPFSLPLLPFRSVSLFEPPDCLPRPAPSGADYERFLHATLTRSVLSAELVAESERDYTPFLADFYTLYGDYGFGHFLECFDSPGGFTAECAERQVHCDPGAYGFYPLVDRKLGFYMEIVAYEANATRARRAHSLELFLLGVGTRVTA